MTREEFFKKYNSLETESNELKENLCNIEKESNMLMTENAKNLLGIEEGDIIYQKRFGIAFKIYNIFIKNNVIYLSIESCGTFKHTMCIDEKMFLSDYTTKGQL